MSSPHKQLTDAFVLVQMTYFSQSLYFNYKTKRKKYSKLKKKQQNCEIGCQPFSRFAPNKGHIYYKKIEILSISLLRRCVSSLTFKHKTLGSKV